MEEDRSRYRLLWVDDDALILEVVRDMLQLSGYKVTAVGGGEAALELLEAQNFDLVLTDLRMPVVDGLTVARKAKEKNSRTPVVLISGCSASYEDAIHRETCVNKLLPKPVNFTELIETMDEMLLLPGKRVERRSYERTRARDTIVVALVPEDPSLSVLFGEIADIGLGGFSFQYAANGCHVGGTFQVNMFCQKCPSICMGRCQIVHATSLPGEPGETTSSLAVCGAKFIGLSNDGLSQVDRLIRDCSNAVST